MSNKLAGKVALVTGGNSGIGLATARRFAMEGAYVFITGRRKKELDDAVALIGPNSYAIQSDVSNLADLDRLFARIDHSAGAAQAGLSLRPTILLIFGSTQVGTILMQANQSIGLDLPLRALVWQDDQCKTWITSKSPVGLAERYRVVGSSIDHAVHAMATAVEAVMHAASSAV